MTWDDPRRSHDEVALPSLVIVPGELDRIRELALRGTETSVRTERVVDYARRVAIDDPERIAIVDGVRHIGYAQLCRWVDGLVAMLRAGGVPSGSVVAYYGPRSIEQIVALLATDALSATYLPIETAWPSGRVESVLELADVRTVLRHPESAMPPIGSIDIVQTDGDAVPSRDQQPHPSSTDLSYIIFTSGTTGQPKGATVERRGMLNHLWAKVSELRLSADDVVAYTAPIGFDISIWQMLAPLLVGGSVQVLSDRDLAFPRRLLDRLRDGRVTIAELVPTVIRWLVAGVNAKAVDTLSLRCLLSTGEELSPPLAGQVLAELGDTRLINAYGPTECSDDVTHARIAPADTERARLPIGKPVQNTALHVLCPTDDGWRSADDGEQGELFVGGIGVGRGYVRNTLATQSAFFRDAIDPQSPTGRLYRTGDFVVRHADTLEYRGRLDRQIKLAGVRMELDEIQIAIESHPLVHAAAVTVSDDEHRAAITAHVVFAVPTWDFGPIKQHLTTSLPPAMVPTRWIAWEALPQTPNGKIDHRDLTK